ncbi:hypothetical protein C6990_10215 [Nitrosopumilus sp. b3]|nr:hypothetical protein C6990_10215 [Nitrosopumilus sp. b3]
MKKLTFVGLVVVLVSIASLSSFFIGVYSANFESKDIQFNTSAEILKLGSQTESNPVVAEVNGQEIRSEEVNNVIKSGFTQGQTLDSKSALNLVITKVLLLEEAQKRDIVITMLDAEEKLTTSYVQQGFSKEQFEEKLGEFGTTYDQTLDRFHDELVINKMLTDEISNMDTQVSDEEIKIFFDENNDMIKTQIGNNTEFDDVTSMIKENLLQQKQQQIALDFVENLESKAVIIIYEERL